MVQGGILWSIPAQILDGKTFLKFLQMLAMLGWGCFIPGGHCTGDLGALLLQSHQPGLLPATGKFLCHPGNSTRCRILSASPCFSLSLEPRKDGAAPVVPLYLGAGADPYS